MIRTDRDALMDARVRDLESALRAITNASPPGISTLVEFEAFARKTAQDALDAGKTIDLARRM